MTTEAPADQTLIPKDDITGVILAGGRGRRMGGQDKGLIKLYGRPMVEYGVCRLRPQVGHLLINANRNLDEYAKICKCTVIEDIVGEFAGPLAGMASAMKAASTRYIATAPCDSPLIAMDFTERLFTRVQGADAEIGVAYGAGRIQPVFALLRCELHFDLLDFLGSGESKIDRWYAEHTVTEVDFSDRSEMFLNVNTPEERLEIEGRLSV